MQLFYKKLVLLALGMLLLLCFVLFFAHWYRAQNTPPAYTGPVEKITIGNVGEYSIFNLIALDKGYFKENGLDVTITEYASGPPAVADLLAGKVDFAIAADFVGVRNIFTNPDLRIVTQASKHKVFHLLARKDKGIQTPADLKGKTVGVTRKGAGEFYLGRFLLFHHLRLQDIIVRNMTPQEMVTQLKNGTIDAVVLFDPHAYHLQKELGDAVIQWSVQGEQNVFAIMYSTNTYLTKHLAIATRLLQALLQAEQFTREHPVEVQAFLAKKFQYDPAYITYMWSNFTFAHGLDQELLLTMEDEARWVIENKITDQKQVPNYLDYIYFDALKNVKPDAITIIW